MEAIVGPKPRSPAKPMASLHEDFSLPIRPGELVIRRVENIWLVAFNAEAMEQVGRHFMSVHGTVGYSDEFTVVCRGRIRCRTVGGQEHGANPVIIMQNAVSTKF